MDTLDPANKALAQSYDEVPYDSRPFPQSHPARSAALARLFGVVPPDLATARVLELGSAAGGNLIPMAVAFPAATFTGVDLSAVQVAQGQARIAALGINNITLRNQSILDLTRGHGEFDYIICHGVYSWVPAAVRDAILRVSSENLAPNGIAYVSYNVFPGWRLRGVLREAMLFHVAGIADPAVRAARARAFLNQLAEITDGNSAYGQMLRQEAQGLTGQGDYYVIHEYLEHTNEPCYVRDFLLKAESAGLAYLTEANLNVTIAESFGPEKGKILRELSGNRLLEMEQYIDFLTGRTFRQSLLVKSEQAVNINRNLEPARINGLHIQANVSLAEETGGQFTLRDPAGRTLTTQSSMVRDALVLLGRHFPNAMTPEALADAVASTAPPSDEDRAHISDALFKMVLIGMAEFAVTPSAPELTASDRPRALELARKDALAGRPWTTNLRHECVPLSVIQHAVVPLLDGRHDADQLAAAVEEKVRDGQILLHRDGVPLTDRSEIAKAAREHLSMALEACAKGALLV